MKTNQVIALIFSIAFILPVLVSAQVSGQGPVVKQEFQLDAFRSIGLGVAAEVYLTPGATQKVVVEGQQNIIDLLKKEVEKGSWNIGFPNNTRVRNYQTLKVYITLPKVEGLSIGGSGKIITQQPFAGLDKLDFSIGGSGTIEFAGSANALDISIGGSGNVKGEKLKVGECRVSIGGSGSAYVEVDDKLDVSIAGSGNVYYGGRPKVNSAIAGSGKVRSM